MQIHYDAVIPDPDQPLVMCRGPRERVEMHLRRDELGHYALFAFAGAGSQPERTQQQGPYHSLAQAQGARRAIATALLGQGYRTDTTHAIWTLMVQRALRAGREERERHAASYRFDPKDVYLDW